MIKRTIKYVDYDDVEKTEDVYFNLSESELTKLDAKYEGGLQAMIYRIVDAKEIKNIMEMFEMILHISYGEKSPDGKYFWKKDKDGRDLATNFEQSAAYNQLFTELLSDPEGAGNFINGILPKDRQQQAKA